MTIRPVSRRGFLASAATALSAARLLAARKNLPIGIQLYSVRGDLKKDLPETVRAIAKMGYQGVEFYAPYYAWDAEYARSVRKLLDETGMRCFSTHNAATTFLPANLTKAIELNHIIGSKAVVMAHPGKVEGGADGWKAVADKLNAASEILGKEGLRAGYHNHNPEFRPLDGGPAPIEIIAKNTRKEVTLQLDVANCLDSGGDPVKYIKTNAGRIKSMHIKDWSPEQGKAYAVILGDGSAKWDAIFNTAESIGGVEYYLIEQEACAHPEMEAAKLSLDAYRRLHG
jgi:sugar phosphate isomerase/epimerase